MRLPRDEILDRTDLHALADELLGPRRRGGWPCPAPHHGPQTGATPPVHLFTSTRGEQRWHCHACGTGGTAIDLLILTQGLRVRDALEELAARAGLARGLIGPVTVVEPRDSAPRPTRGYAPSPKAIEPSPVLERYVRDCEAFLWSPDGQEVRDWLSARQLGEEVLRVNRVGADPGPSQLTRAFGLPHGGLGAVFPVLDEDSRALYAQLRYLRPETAGRKYANPTRKIARRPDLAVVRTPRDSATTRVIVCEGLPDALSAAQAGSRAVAILGTGADDGRVAAELHRRFPDNRLVIAMDADEAGRRAAERLVTALRRLDRHDMDRLDVPEQCGDLNGWLCGNTAQFVREVQVVARGPAVDPSATRSRAVDLAPVSFELDG